MTNPLNEMTSVQLRETIKLARALLKTAVENERQRKIASKQMKIAARNDAKAERARLKEVRVAEQKAKADARLKATEERLEKARARVLALAAGNVGTKAKREARKPGKVTVSKG